ncbi:MAG TPA: hypothetical protein PK852_02720 [Mesotoga prima]|uniref:hypothetical protein n=1 Tax=Mesotoga prima TaxID=1184387 RepID=UPI002C68DE38|nr:hypothetical protein [Mesotoga prima]HPE53009.1 hypothetical protein [Mesotoga prima]
MARRVRTAKQKAALRKAQAASARKRRKGGKKKAGVVRRAGREVKRRYQAGHKGPGAHYRRARDYYNSEGYYKTRTGGSKKRAGKIQRGYRKANSIRHANYASLTMLGVSYARDKKRRKSRR